jgi:MFS family permease
MRRFGRPVAMPHSLPHSPIPLNRLRPGRPSGSDTIHNAWIMRWDSVAMGVVNAASPFLPVLIARLGGTAFTISLLTSVPAVAGFTLAIPIGQFLQRRGNPVKWYSTARLISNSSYALIGLTVALAPHQAVIPIIVAIWALAAIPSTMGAVLFPIVMDGAAGPHGRLELMSRRWSWMGLTMAITVSIVGIFLERVPLPWNYAIAFMSFSVGGVASYFFSRQFRIPRVAPPPRATDHPTWRQRFRNARALMRSQPAFLHYSLRQLVYVSGTRLALPLIPLYFVTVVKAPDAWIGIIATGQSLALLSGYQFWKRQSRIRGTRILLLIVMLVSALYPAALSLTDRMIIVAVLATIASFFSAGVDLILFDELMSTVPRQYGVTFASIDTTLVNMATIVMPLVGAAISGVFGIETALRFSAFLSLCGLVLFTQSARRRGKAPTTGSEAPIVAVPA